MHSGGAFRARPEHELRAADIACLPSERHAHVDPVDNIRGAPGPVIVFLSPSNPVAAINGKVKLCLADGAREPWVLNPDLRPEKVATLKDTTTTGRPAQDIPLRVLGTGVLRVLGISA